MGKNDNLIDIIRLLVDKRKKILLISISACLLAAGISIFLPNYYKATTTFYAASPDLSKPERIFGYSSYDMSYYGTGLDVDRLMTIGFSNELAEFLIDSFDLFEHYQIDTADARAEYKIKMRLSSIYELVKTKYDAIELSVEDKDKDIVAAMANAARSKINELAQKVIKNSQQQVISAYTSSLDEKRRQLNSLSDSLRATRSRYGIFNTESQAEALASIVSRTESSLVRESERLRVLKATRGVPRDTIAYLSARVSGLEKELNSLTTDDGGSRFNMTNFNKGKETVDLLTQSYEQISKQVSYDQVRLEQIQTAYDTDITTVHLVEQAKDPVIKSRPKRSILVLGIGFVAFVLSSLYFIVLASWKDNNWTLATK
jgi:LPS O-antigen subunit length determinant protein (WzzB/FepE family)